MARYNPNPSAPQTAYIQHSNPADMQAAAAAYMAALAGRLISAITLTGGGAGSLFILAIEHTPAADGVGIDPVEAAASFRVYSAGTAVAATSAYNAALADAMAANPGVPLRDAEIEGSSSAAVFFGFLVLATQQGGGCCTALSVRHEMIVSSVPGRNNYTIPVGNWFWNAVGETTLDINTGTGWIAQAYGADYAHLQRVTPPPTVADAAIGFTLVGGVVPTGWLLRFRWFERTLLVKPSAVAKVRVPTTYTAPWNSSSGVDFPNGVRVPEFPNVQVEFWRQTWRNGGQRGNMGVLRRDGKRYLPYFRGALNQFTFALSEFRSKQPLKRNHFRVCYYDPATGARSALCPDVIVVCNDQQADRVNGRFARTRGSVWIE